MTFGEKLRLMGEKSRLSQAEIATAIGLQQSRVQRWMAGEGQPKPEQVVRLARLFGVTCDYLIDEAQDEPVPALAEGQRLILEAVEESRLTTIEAIRAIHRYADAKGKPPATGDYPGDGGRADAGRRWSPPEHQAGRREA